nr:hypothetical protein BaRGS_011764 [Batillaria attramentaria]
MYDFQNNDGDMEKAIKDLETAASKDVGRLYVVIDEAGPEHGCPPAVTRQITDSSLIKEEYVYGYTVDPELPPPTDGPKVHWPRHDRGVAHEGKPEDCHQCGVGIANILDKDLNLNPNGEEGALQYRDVLILCNNARDEEKDSNGKVITPASGIIQVKNRLYIE